MEDSSYVRQVDQEVELELVYDPRNSDSVELLHVKMTDLGQKVKLNDAAANDLEKATREQGKGASKFLWHQARALGITGTRASMLVSSYGRALTGKTDGTFFTKKVYSWGSIIIKQTRTGPPEKPDETYFKGNEATKYGLDKENAVLQQYERALKAQASQLLDKDETLQSSDEATLSRT